MHATESPIDPAAIREHLVEALRLDLVGPWDGHELDAEQLPGRERPSNWYVAGFLIPTGTAPEHTGDADEDDDLDTIPESAGLPEESNDERKAARKAFFPSSIGLSFLVPAACRELAVTVRWGDYAPAEIENAGSGKTPVWRRTAREETLLVPLGGDAGPVVRDVPGSGGLQLHVVERPIGAIGTDGSELAAGTRSASCFLVNRRTPTVTQPDCAYAFQAEIEVRANEDFVPRPDLRGAHAAEWDDQVADLHYADTPEYATGHGVSAEWDLDDGGCRALRTAWIARAEVEKTAASNVPGVELSMEILGQLDGVEPASQALGPLIEQYRGWIEARRRETESSALQGARRETAEQLLDYATVAADRMAGGVARLGEDADLLDAFRVANRAVARALRQRLGNQIGADGPRWRPFQLAFLLLNLPGLADPTDPHRETVDLLFFPTGGGKTEAYLGLAAVAMVLRRLRHPGDEGLAGAGVSVIMRYTLRLLTLDQLARAAGLVCALELERRESGARYGSWPFEIGLWVGKAATPNILGRKGDDRPDSARAKVTAFKKNPDRNPSPIPLENCPWCGREFRPESFDLQPDADQPTELRIVCANWQCDFTADRPLPVIGVDEPLYRRLPAFLIATVDKFASLPWVGQSGALLGGADRADANGFYGAAEPARGKRLTTPLPPPDLVIQDELHLIAGPLGTMAGLYETVIEGLALGEVDGHIVKPKIIASTATVRRAEDQIQALFARALTQVFPPPGPNRRDTFFARTVPPSETSARRYVGIASQGRNPKVLMRRVLLALMGAAQQAWHEAGGDRNPR
ncbi:MAG: helicase, partial [Acidobacteria bacterium]|nr:helicase [Acidobacteriota bacterium]